MSNSEYITLPKPLRIFQVSLDQTRHEILASIAAPQQSRIILRKGLSLGHLLERHPCDQRILGAQPGDKLPQRITPQQLVQLGNLADHAVIRLRVIDRLNGVVHVTAFSEEPEASAKSDFSEDIEGEVMKEIAEIENAPVGVDVLVDFAG